MGGVDAGVGVDVDVETGDGEALGVVVRAGVAARDGATEAVAVGVGGIDVDVGVDVGVDGGEGVALGVVVGVRETVGDGLGTAVEVGEGVEVGVRVGSVSPTSIGALPEASVSVKDLSDPLADVDRSNAWTVAMRLSSALFLCIARTTKNVNSTANTIMTNPKPIIGRPRLLIFIFVFSHIQEGTTKGLGSVDI